MASDRVYRIGKENFMRILFQGDSITDFGRIKTDEKDMGMGYPLLVKSELGFDYPGEYEFFNRGINGNRIVDIYARMKSDILYLKPDVMSILVGTNDAWHDIYPIPNGVDTEKYFKVYCMLIEEIKQALPDIRIMIMGSFVLNCPSREQDWDYLSREVSKRAEMAKKVAEKYGLEFIELQSAFDNAAKICPGEYWLADGVHPTPMGHELIKRKWIEVFKK